MDATAKPLAGIKVVDFSAVYAGPICSRMLADCGADVIKIETIHGGDFMRGPSGTSRVFSHFNAGKRSVALDLNQPKAQDIAKRLLQSADVTIENFRPGVMKSFGLDYGSVKRAFPKIIYCSISGFGQTGPFAQRAAYAPIAHAASGFDYACMSSQGVREKRPPASGVMIADILTGSYAFGAIQTALIGRGTTGHGEFIDVTMMESMMSLIPRQIQDIQVHSNPRDGGFQPIRVKDGYVMICIVSDKNMRQLANAMMKPDLLVDERFASRTIRYKHMDELVAEIEAWSAPLTRLECETRLNESGVPCSVYNTVRELLTHPQIVQRQSFKQLEDEHGAYLIQNPPFQFTESRVTTADSVPALGEHTSAVLGGDLGYEDNEIARLIEQGVVFQAVCG